MNYIDLFDGLTLVRCVCGALVRSKQEPEVGIYLSNATSCANSYRGLGSLIFCSSNNKFCFGGTCIKNDSQIYFFNSFI
jgi:hypothetical protein